jgi:hypothetical protein
MCHLLITGICQDAGGGHGLLLEGDAKEHLPEQIFELVPMMHPYFGTQLCNLESVAVEGS